MLRGEPDTTVTVTFERDTKRPIVDPNPEDLGQLREVSDVGLGLSFTAPVDLEINSRKEPNSIAESRSTSRSVRTFEVDLPRSNVRLNDVKLSVLLDQNGSPIDFNSVIRKHAAEPTKGVALQIKPVGFIQLTGFTQDAGLEVLRSYASLEAEARVITGDFSGSPQLAGLVLDLRGNPGGLLSSAVTIISLS
jgi:hypothetical protein